MARPIKKRTAVSYARDVEALNRLRTAIKLDRSLPVEPSKEAVKAIDIAVDKVSALIEIE